ncbi:MAG: hypothetical protein WDN04_16965 [Rhodospirillales bacterium]
MLDDQALTGGIGTATTLLVRDRETWAWNGWRPAASESTIDKGCLRAGWAAGLVALAGGGGTPRMVTPSLGEAEADGVTAKAARVIAAMAPAVR